MFPTRFIAQASLIGVLGLSASLMPLPSVTPVVMAQTATQRYNAAMQMGYSLTARRDYQSALVNFQKALSLRPGDRYAQVAISNVQAYIARDRVASRPGTQKPWLDRIPNVGMPNVTVAGATRSSCITDNQQLTSELIAMAPKNGSLTASNTPELFFYKPAVLTNLNGWPRTTAELVVFDEKGNLLQQREFGIPSERGIVKVSLDLGTQGLEAGKKYKWNFALVCHNSPRDSQPIAVLDGGIVRVDIDPNMLQAINSTPMADRLPLYYSAQIWNDTLTTLAQLQKSNPGNSSYQKEWQTYLQEAGVNPGIATMPILDCCQAK